MLYRQFLAVFLLGQDVVMSQMHELVHRAGPQIDNYATVVVINTVHKLEAGAISHRCKTITLMIYMASFYKYMTITSGNVF